MAGAYLMMLLTPLGMLIPLIWGIFKTKSASNFGGVGLLSLGVYVGQLAMYVLAILISSGKEAFGVLYMTSALVGTAPVIFVLYGVLGYFSAFAVLAACFYVYVAEGS
jgi:hypothetical protein